MSVAIDSPQYHMRPIAYAERCLEPEVQIPNP
jgi:hypothetical protein